MEMMNEVCITFATQQLLLFTEYVPEAKERTLCGWIFAGTLFLQITINLALIVYEMARSVKLILQRYNNRIQNWMKPVVPPPIEPALVNVIELARLPSQVDEPVVEVPHPKEEKK